MVDSDDADEIFVALRESGLLESDLVSPGETQKKKAREEREGQAEGTGDSIGDLEYAKVHKNNSMLSIPWEQLIFDDGAAIGRGLCPRSVFSISYTSSISDSLSR